MASQAPPTFECLLCGHVHETSKRSFRGTKARGLDYYDKDSGWFESFTVCPWCLNSKWNSMQRSYDQDNAPYEQPSYDQWHKRIYEEAARRLSKKWSRDCTVDQFTMGRPLWFTGESNEDSDEEMWAAIIGRPEKPEAPEPMDISHMQSEF